MRSIRVPTAFVLDFHLQRGPPAVFVNTSLLLPSEKAHCLQRRLTAFREGSLPSEKAHCLQRRLTAFREGHQLHSFIPLCHCLQPIAAPSFSYLQTLPLERTNYITIVSSDTAFREGQSHHIRIFRHCLQRGPIAS